MAGIAGFGLNHLDQLYARKFSGQTHIFYGTFYVNGYMSDGKAFLISKYGYHFSAKLCYYDDGIAYLLVNDFDHLRELTRDRDSFNIYGSLGKKIISRPADSKVEFHDAYFASVYKFDYPDDCPDTCTVYYSQDRKHCYLTSGLYFRSIRSH